MPPQQCSYHIFAIDGVKRGSVRNQLSPSTCFASMRRCLTLKGDESKPGGNSSNKRVKHLIILLERFYIFEYNNTFQKKQTQPIKATNLQISDGDVHCL